MDRIPRPIVINAVESSSSPVTSTRRDRRDDNYEIIPASSSTRRHHQRYLSSGAISTDEDSRDKVYLLSRPSIKERRDESSRFDAEFRPRTRRPRGYISAPVADYQEEQLPELESVMGPQNSSSPLPVQAVDSLSRLSSSEVYDRQERMGPPRKRTSRIRETVVMEETIKSAPPPSTSIEDEPVEKIEERDDSSPWSFKKLSAFTHGESDGGNPTGADMEVVDRLVMLWTTVKPQ